MQSLTPQTPIRSWAVMSRLDGGQRWKIEHAKNASVTTLAELAAWGRPKQGQWSGFGKTKIAAWTAILAEAGLEWRGMAPVYPRGNPMYANITPMTEEPEDIVYRLQVAIDSGWLGRFPVTERDIIADAIREIRGLRSGQDVLMESAEISRQAMDSSRRTIERLETENRQLRMQLPSPEWERLKGINIRNGHPMPHTCDPVRDLCGDPDSDLDGEKLVAMRKEVARE